MSRLAPAVGQVELQFDQGRQIRGSSRRHYKTILPSIIVSSYTLQYQVAEKYRVLGRGVVLDLRILECSLLGSHHCFLGNEPC